MNVSFKHRPPTLEAVLSSAIFLLELLIQLALDPNDLSGRSCLHYIWVSASVHFNREKSNQWVLVYFSASVFLWGGHPILVHTHLSTPLHSTRTGMKLCNLSESPRTRIDFGKVCRTPFLVTHRFEDQNGSK